LEDLGVDEKIIGKLILRKYYKREWPGFNWLAISSGGIL
jgi:hypothetical protein